MQQVRIFTSNSLFTLEHDINFWSANRTVKILNTSITCDTDNYYVCVVTYSI